VMTKSADNDAAHSTPNQITCGWQYSDGTGTWPAAPKVGLCGLWFCGMFVAVRPLQDGACARCVCLHGHAHVHVAQGGIHHPQVYICLPCNGCSCSLLASCFAAVCSVIGSCFQCTVTVANSE
jgi:hypothetical protein